MFLNVKFNVLERHFLKELNRLYSTNECSHIDCITANYRCFQWRLPLSASYCCCCCCWRSAAGRAQPVQANEYTGRNSIEISTESCCFTPPGTSALLKRAFAIGKLGNQCIWHYTTTLGVRPLQCSCAFMIGKLGDLCTALQALPSVKEGTGHFTTG